MQIGAKHDVLQNPKISGISLLCIVGGEENQIHAEKMVHHCKIFGRLVFRWPDSCAQGAKMENRC